MSALFEAIEKEEQPNNQARKIVIDYNKSTGKLTLDPGDETQPTLFVFNGITGVVVERQR